jgi:hypothetical protein
MAIAAFYAVAGIYDDLGWHLRHSVDTFWTPQHAVVYSGLLLLFGIVGIEAIRHYRPGAKIADCVPPGYFLSLVGIALFFVGGLADLIKHTHIGFEPDYDALVNPTHLTFGFGILLAVCGPLRSALFAPRPRTFAGLMPAIVSTAGILELLHWATNPFFRVDMERSMEVIIPRELTPDALTLQTLHLYQQGAGFLAVILQSVLLAGAAIYLARNFRLPFGALSVLFVLGNGLIAVTNSLSWGEAGAIYAASVVAGIVGDLFLRDREALLRSRLRFGAFAFFVPAAYHVALLVMTAIFLGGVWWDPSIAAGIILDSGIFGVFLGIVAFPSQPGMPADAA